MDKGIYCLVFRNPDCTLIIGALGRIAFNSGWHLYVGSALGSGGLKRLERHISLARNHDKQPKWHVDYLLTSPCFVLAYAVFAVTSDHLECRVVQELSDCGVPAFGCSDCSCESHLMFRGCNPEKEVATAFRHLSLEPVTKTIMSSHVDDYL